MIEDEDEPALGWMAEYIAARLHFLGIDEITATNHAVEMEEWLRLAIDLHRDVDSPWP